MENKSTPSRISIGDIRVESKLSKQKDNGRILYMPSDTGFTQKKDGEQIYYFGLTSTIPIQSYPFNIFEHEINMADLFTVLKDHSGDLIPLNNGIIERYEIQDIHSCDVHVMYRVPYIRWP
jgi:hypothetical protein